MSAIELSVDSTGLALVAIETSARCVQPFIPKLPMELAAAVRTLADDSTIKSVVVRLSGDASVQEPSHSLQVEHGVTALVARDMARAWQRTLRQLETCGRPVAAILSGSISDAYLDVALACHYRVAIDDPRTCLRYPEVTQGLLPSGGGTQRLPRLIGVQRALPLLLNGDAIAAAEARRLGIVDAVVASDSAITAAREWSRSNLVITQPWDRKGFCIPGGAGPLASFASETFMIGAARLRRQLPELQSASLAILSCVYEGTICAFDAGLAIESNYFGKVASESLATAR